MIYRRNAGKFYFLGIGIDEYLHQKKLSNAVSDVQAVKKILINQYTFDECNVKCIFNKEVVFDNVRRVFYDLNKDIQPNDSLLIYFAGHGFIDEDRDGSWIPHDAETGKYEKYMEYFAIKKNLSKNKAKHILLISDTCFSSSIFYNTRDVFYHNDTGDYALYDKLGKLKSRWAITSGEGKVSDGESCSPFAEAIIKFLGDNTSRLKLAASELSSYTRTYVIQKLGENQIARGGALNDVGDNGGEFIFLLRDNPEDEWQKLQQEKSIEGYYQFLRKFPNDPRTREVKGIIAAYEEARTDWIELTKKHKGNLDSFLKEHHHSSFDEIARKEKKTCDTRLSDLTKKEREENDWKEVSKINEISNYSSFEEQYPNGQYYEQSKARRKILQQKKEEEKAWNENFEAFKRASKPLHKKAPIAEYLEKYPHGMYSTRANNLIKEINQYKKVAKKKTLELYREYNKSYPDGYFSRQAKKNIQELEEQIEREKAAFQKAEKENTIEGYEKYLIDFPNSKYELEAQQKIDELKIQEEDLYKKIKAENTLTAYQNYANNYPKGKYIQEVQQKIEQLQVKDTMAFEQAVQENTIDSYTEYLDFFIDGIYEKEAQSRKEELEQSDDDAFWNAYDKGTIKALQQYLLGFKNGLSKQPAENRIKELEAQQKETTPSLHRDILASAITVEKVEEEAFDVKHVVSSSKTEEKELKPLEQAILSEQAIVKTSKIIVSDDTVVYRVALEKNTIEAYKRFLVDYPNSIHVHHINDKIKDIKREKWQQRAVKYSAVAALSLTIFLCVLFLKKGATEPPVPRLSSFPLRTTPSKAMHNVASQDSIKPLTPMLNANVHSPRKSYHLIANVFKKEQNAKQFLKEKQEKGFEQARIIRDKAYYFVSVQQYNTEKKAFNAMLLMKNRFDDIWVQEWQSTTTNE